MIFPSKFGVRIIQVCVLYSNFYCISHSQTFIEADIAAFIQNKTNTNQSITHIYSIEKQPLQLITDYCYSHG